MKIFDCSNSGQRPQNRGFGGPVENANVTLLKQKAYQYNAEFVDVWEDADLIFTNDVYPEHLLCVDKPRVKRMDGVFWQADLEARNKALNAAALQSHCVVFISEYSEKSFPHKQLYHEDRRVCVIHNSVDSGIFRRSRMRHRKNAPDIWVAAATHWGRPEKRFDDILFFGEWLQKSSGILLLIGTLPHGFDVKRLPTNVFSLGYIEDPRRIAAILQKADAFVNLSYKDAAPKVVIEATYCGLPVLFADSGGVPELVQAGIRIPDKEESDRYTPSLSKIDIDRRLTHFLDTYPGLDEKARTVVPGDMKMVEDYFKVFKEEIANHEARRDRVLHADGS